MKCRMYDMKKWIEQIKKQDIKIFTFSDLKCHNLDKMIYLRKARICGFIRKIGKKNKKNGGTSITIWEMT